MTVSDDGVSSSVGSESIVSDDLSAAFISPSPENDDDTGLDFDLDALETPSDSESLHFPIYDLDLEGERSNPFILWMSVKNSICCDSLFYYIYNL